MYNSRPRYDRYSNPINLPENYSGNAFSAKEQESVPDIQEEFQENIVSNENESEKEEREVISMSKKNERFKIDVGHLFRGGIGIEELLIIGLILLIAQSEDNDDIILLLALLLFIK